MKKRSNFLLIAMVMFGLTTLLSSCGQTEKQTVIDKIQKAGELKVATSGNQFPFSFKDKDGTLKGIDIIIGKRIAEEMGVKVKYVEADLSTIIDVVASGKADIAISELSVTAERNMKVMFTDAYFVTGKGILSSNSGIQRAKEGSNKESQVTLVVIDNSSSLKYANDHYPNAKLIKTKNIVESKEILYTGKADGLLADYEICEQLSYDKRNKGDYKFERIGEVSDKEFISIAVTPGDDLLFNTVNNLIDKVKSTKVDEMVDQSWMFYLN